MHGIDQNETPFAVPNGSQPTYSIKKEFSGATVMITGASGYIGSLVVEQLLRTTDVSRIYVLIRGKRGCTAQERLARLLQSGLFHMVRDSPTLLAKVELLEGDMNSDDLGLCPKDLERVFNNVHFVIHSAASIELEADVQHTLRSNYLGTRRLLALCSQMRHLRCMLHVSTAYVNVNFPKGSSVEERIYPLYIGQQEVSHADVVDDLMSLKPQAASVRAQMYLDMWGFPNTYTMGKNLTEKLVASYHKQCGLPIAIVRPSLVCGLAGAPYPGYCGNLAGPIGMGVAMAVGLFDRLESVAMVPTHVWDAVPGDVVSSVILAAAAARAADVEINQYTDSANGSNDDPMVFHAGTSTTYPISMVEAFYAALDFVRQNPPPFRLPGGGLFTLPLDYRPNEEAVKRCKYWTAWKVWFAVRLLERLGQHKTARRLKYGHMAWEIQNSSKTDRHLFFGSKNLLQLEAQLDAADAAAADYKVTWTIRNGGWPRYISTNIAGMYRIVFGISKVVGLEDSDFKFIPARSVRPKATVDQEEAGPTTPLQTLPEGDEEGEPQQEEDVITQGFKRTAASFSQIPASGANIAPNGLIEPAAAPAPAEGVHVDYDDSSSGAGSIRPTRANSSDAIRTEPENTPGLGMVLSARLGHSLSYKATSMTDVPSGAVSGGALNRMLSKPVQRIGKRPTPTNSVRDV